MWTPQSPSLHNFLGSVVPIVFVSILSRNPQSLERIKNNQKDLFQMQITGLSPKDLTLLDCPWEWNFSNWPGLLKCRQITELWRLYLSYSFRSLHIVYFTYLFTKWITVRWGILSIATQRTPLKLSWGILSTKTICVNERLLWLLSEGKWEQLED